MKTKNLQNAAWLTILMMLSATIFTNAQISFQGLQENHEGAAAWNADGNGPEPEAYGHMHPFGWGSSCYYGASRDYDDIDSLPDAAMCHLLDDITGFPLFVQALADNGFSPGQVKIKCGLINEGNDLEGEDWFTFNERHYLNKYDGIYSLELNGEPMISGYISFALFSYDNAIYNSWQLETNYADLVDASSMSSAPVQEVAGAFLQDMNGEQLRMIFENMESTGIFFNGKGRVEGVYFNVTGYLEKGQPELPFTGPASAHEGIAGWNADGSGPEPAAEGHTFYYGGTDYWMAYYIASRDYDDIDPDPGAALCHVTGVGTGFPNLEIQMAYRGYNMDQMKVKSGIATLGNDIEGVDWWLDGSIHYYHTYGNTVTVEIAGEPILEYTTDTNFTSANLNTPDGHWLSYSTLSPVVDISTNTSPNAQFVALSLMKDIGDRFIKSAMEGGGVNSFNDPENGREGAFHNVDSGYLTLGPQDTLNTGIAEDQMKVELLKVQPNPFRNSVQIIFELPNVENVVLEVYNAVGARVATVEERFFVRGIHHITLDARGLIDGIYIFRLQAGNKIFTRKIIKMNGF